MSLKWLILIFQTWWLFFLLMKYVDFLKMLAAYPNTHNFKAENTYRENFSVKSK